MLCSLPICCVRDVSCFSIWLSLSVLACIPESLSVYVPIVIFHPPQFLLFFVSHLSCCHNLSVLFFTYIFFNCLRRPFFIVHICYFSFKLPFFLLLFLSTFTSSLSSHLALVSPPPSSSASVFHSQWKISPLHYLWRVAALCSCQMQQTAVLFSLVLTCTEFQGDSRFMSSESKSVLVKMLVIVICLLSCVASQKNMFSTFLIHNLGRKM